MTLLDIFLLTGCYALVVAIFVLRWVTRSRVIPLSEGDLTQRCEKCHSYMRLVNRHPTVARVLILIWKCENNDCENFGLRKKTEVYCDNF